MDGIVTGCILAVGRIVGESAALLFTACLLYTSFTIKDYTQVDEKAVKAAGAAGVIRPDKSTCQVVIGTKVQFVYDELKKML